MSDLIKALDDLQKEKNMIIYCRESGRMPLKMRWCSILVRSTCSQDGPKNPLKGISMKFLVLALNAQFGVGAGS